MAHCPTFSRDAQFLSFQGANISEKNLSPKSMLTKARDRFYVCKTLDLVVSGLIHFNPYTKP